MKNYTFTVSVLANPNTTQRSGTITVTGSGITRTINVTQRGAPATYTVSYNANGGSGAPASQTKTQGVSLTLSNTKPVRAGFTFLGWNSTARRYSNTVEYPAGGTNIYTADKTDTLYAVWTDITVDRVVIHPATVTLTTGDTRELTATVVPPTAANQNVTWSSSNSNIATVTATGTFTARVRAQNPGTVTIRVRADNGITGICTVTVVAPSTPPVTVDLFADGRWRLYNDNLGRSWQAETATLFNRAKTAFLQTWDIDLVFTLQEITLPGEDCPWVFSGSLCSTSCCGANCVQSHNRSASKALAETIARTNRTLGLSMVGYHMCWHSPNNEHLPVNGLARHSSKGAVVRGITDYTLPENILRTRNVIQHELSHNYGCWDEAQRPRPCRSECIMSGGFRTEYEDRADIWCSDCIRDFNPNLF